VNLYIGQNSKRVTCENIVETLLLSAIEGGEGGRCATLRPTIATVELG
jgi:hypothetical protein